MASTLHEVPSWAKQLSEYQNRTIQWAITKSMSYESKGGVLVTASGPITETRVRFLDVRISDKVERGQVAYADRRYDPSAPQDQDDMRALLAE